jgi:hypothetical protein
MINKLEIERSPWSLAAELCGDLDNLSDVVVLPGTPDALISLERVAGTCAQAIRASQTNPVLAGLTRQFGVAVGEIAARWAGVETVDPADVLYLSADVMDALDQAAPLRTALSERINALAA